MPGSSDDNSDGGDEGAGYDVSRMSGEKEDPAAYDELRRNFDALKARQKTSQGGGGRSSIGNHGKAKTTDIGQVQRTKERAASAGSAGMNDLMSLGG